MSNYPPPVRALLSRGKPRSQREWDDYLALGLTAEHIPDLIRMAVDPELNEGDGDSREVWAPLYAWRALGQLRAVEAIEPLLDLFTELEEDGDDYAVGDMKPLFALIGPPSIPALAAY